jgi:hypothetical protein
VNMSGCVVMRSSFLWRDGSARSSGRDSAMYDTDREVSSTVDTLCEGAMMRGDALRTRCRPRLRDRGPVRRGQHAPDRRHADAVRHPDREPARPEPAPADPVPGNDPVGGGTALAALVAAGAMGTVSFFSFYRALQMGPVAVVSPVFASYAAVAVRSRWCSGRASLHDGVGGRGADDLRRGPRMAGSREDRDGALVGWHSLRWWRPSRGARRPT